MSADAQITNRVGDTSPPQRRRPRPPESHKATRRTVELADELAALLTTRPAVLVTEVGEPVRPLKVGARGELIALTRPHLAHHHLHRALRRYTRAVPYLLACLKDGAMRHDLDGDPIEPISEEHRKLARADLAERRRLRAERHKVTRAARADQADDEPGGGAQGRPVEPPEGVAAA